MTCSTCQFRWLGIPSESLAKRSKVPMYFRWWCREEISQVVIEIGNNKDLIAAKGCNKWKA